MRRLHSAPARPGSRERQALDKNVCGSDFEAETLNVYAYGLTFDYQEYGLASAVLVLFTLFIIGVVVLLRRRAGKKEA